MNITLFLSTFIGMFVITDPPGNAAVFMAMTGGLDSNQKRKIALRAVLIACCLLTGFCLVGQNLLAYLKISPAAFLVAGGLLLFVTAFRMIMGFHDPDHLNSNETVYNDRSNLAVFPFAIPFMAGPGCITAALMYVTAAQTPMDYGLVIAAILLIQLISLATMIGSGKIETVLGRTGSSIVARVMGIILAAMAVQFVANGAKELFSG